jgi:hypothetical protein
MGKFDGGERPMLVYTVGEFSQQCYGCVCRPEMQYLTDFFLFGVTGIDLGITEDHGGRTAGRTFLKIPDGRFRDTVFRAYPPYTEGGGQNTVFQRDAPERDGAEKVRIFLLHNIFLLKLFDVLKDRPLILPSIVIL